jgi:DNA primase
MNNIEEIKSRLSILEIVSSYIKVEKSGSQYKARCPFHNERTPSFYVSPTRNSFHCFGCGEGGDIFKFVGKIENMDFKESLHVLAERAGVKLTFKGKEEDSTLVSILSDANLFFIKSLSESPTAIKYLHDRGLSDDLIKEFSIGYAVNDWRKLFTHLMMRGHKESDIVDSGLVIKTEDNKYYDRFRGRVMFPIRNISGAVIGYTGRILPEYDDGKSGKYVNTPETKLYHKSNVLYNYDKARKSMSENREVVLVEGQMDVIMSHAAGIKNVVAVSGTALTDEHVKMIGRLADTVVLALDTDAAGKKAAEKSAIMCAYGDISVMTVELREKDVADTVKEDKDNWINIYKNKTKYTSFLYKSYLLIKEDAERIKYIRSVIAPFLKAIRSEIEREFDINNFSRLSGLSVESVRGEINSIRTDDTSAKEIKEEIRIDKYEELALEIRVLQGELDIKNEVGEADEIPEEVYNKKVIYLTERGALNLSYYQDLIKEYHKMMYDREHKVLSDLVNSGDRQALTKLQELLKSRNE